MSGEDRLVIIGLALFVLIWTLLQLAEADVRINRIIHSIGKEN